MKRYIFWGIVINNKLLASLFILATGLSSNSSATDMKQSIYTSKMPASIGTYSQERQFGNTIYISGQIPVDPKTGKLVQGDVKDQIRQVFTNLSEITKAVGGDMNDIVKLTIYLTNLDNFSAVNEAMFQQFHKPYPALSIIEIKALPKNASVEIEAIIGTRNKLVNDYTD